MLVEESGKIIAGHGRILAAESLGPVMVAAGWSEALSKTKRRAYVIFRKSNAKANDIKNESRNF